MYIYGTFTHVCVCRIVKPVGQSRGRGIKMIRSLKQLADSPSGFGTPDDSLVVQRYVTNPMMVQVCDFVTLEWWTYPQDMVGQCCVTKRHDGCACVGPVGS